VSAADPCDCDVPCPHGRRCSGGHASFPDDHWWPTCDDGCFQSSGEMFRLADGRMLMVAAACRHALGPGPIGEVSRELVTHTRSCPDAVKPQRVKRRAGG
jgi:hypothetical protein